ncbi:methylesterase 17-like [Juglans microcarpa x Juglans regia]|uniref:methylesterase 17-like n=1 Tax=Juglans microcarpa x Juglans regia TaxID=2249226 RepID=UPI001B7F2A7D|nr:methylesterase 17-like [Juglans microcarpa x Juglans regia]
MSETAPNRGLHFVLVHGLGHGAWCWYKVRSLMETSGNRVTCLDLKGAGIHPSHANTVLTLHDYDQPLADFLSKLPQDEKVILVGHSSGGLSLTDAIHRFAPKIHMAIYVAACMLQHGLSTDQDIKDGRPDLPNYVYEKEYKLGTNQPPTGIIMKEQFQRQLMYNLSPKEDAILASMLLRPGPMQAVGGARFVGGPDVDRVPRVYIKTMQDRVLKPEQQDAMIKRWPPSKVFALESDHSPFFSTPSELVAFLVEATSSIKCTLDCV